MLLSIATWSNNADFGMRIIDLQIRSYRDSITVFITRMIAGLGNVFFIYTLQEKCVSRTGSNIRLEIHGDLLSKTVSCQQMRNINHG